MLSRRRREAVIAKWNWLTTAVFFPHQQQLMKIFSLCFLLPGSCLETLWTQLWPEAKHKLVPSSSRASRLTKPTNHWQFWIYRYRISSPGSKLLVHGRGLASALDGFGWYRHRGIFTVILEDLSQARGDVLLSLREWSRNLRVAAGWQVLVTSRVFRERWISDSNVKTSNIWSELTRPLMMT